MVNEARRMERRDNPMATTISAHRFVPLPSDTYVSVTFLAQTHDESRTGCFNDDETECDVNMQPYRY